MLFECGKVAPALIRYKSVGGVGVAANVICDAPWFRPREFNDASPPDGGGYIVTSTGLSLQISDDGKRAGSVSKLPSHQDYNWMIIHEKVPSVVALAAARPIGRDPRNVKSGFI
jgi:hypothetical protein